MSNPHTEILFYAVFSDGNVHGNSNFELVKDPNVLFYLKRISYHHIGPTPYKNYHTYYNYEFLNEQLTEIVPVINKMKLIKLTQFVNTAANPHHESDYSYIYLELLDNKGNIQAIKVKKGNMSVLFNVFNFIDEINHYGGFIAWDVLTKRKFIKENSVWIFDKDNFIIS